jgi:hypothetical protein
MAAPLLVLAPHLHSDSGVKRLISALKKWKMAVIAGNNPELSFVVPNPDL